MLRVGIVLVDSNPLVDVILMCVIHLFQHCLRSHHFNDPSFHVLIHKFFPSQNAAIHLAAVVHAHISHAVFVFLSPNF